MKVASTSSEAEANSAQNSTDDDTATCFATMTENNPWWIVDLEGEYTLYRIDLTTTDGHSGIDSVEMFSISFC